MVQKIKKKSVFISFIAMIAIIISTPILMYFFVDKNNIVVSSIDKEIWLSFWGTYIGACIGGLFTYISLVGTLYHYHEESEYNKRIRDGEEKAQLKRHEEDVSRKLLLDFRPYIVFDSGNTGQLTKLIHVDRYVYSSDEDSDEWSDLRNYDSKLDKELVIRLSNRGLGPAENIRIVYNSSEYNVGGFDDRQLVDQRDSNIIIYNKMSIDLSNGDDIYIQLKLHFSDRMKDSYYTHYISLTFEYNDIRNNKICRTMSMDLLSGSILGCNEQRYVDTINQALFMSER